MAHSQDLKFFFFDSLQGKYVFIVSIDSLLNIGSYIELVNKDLLKFPSKI